MNHFDSAQWAELYKRDPEAFEQKRLTFIDDIIGKSDIMHQQRLKGLQFQIDTTRNLAPNPISALVKISAMMWNALSQLNDACLGKHLDQETRPSAQIIELNLQPGEKN